jgi:hypothetical protein
LDPQALPLKSLAIDISITPTPPCLNDFSKNAESALLTHLSIEARKFTEHDTHNSACQMLIHEVTPSRIAIIPFTIDPLGGLGPFDTAILFRATQTPSVPTLSPTAKAAHSLASGSSKISALLTKADSQWLALYPNRLFGSTFRTPTPSAWSKQIFWSQLLPCHSQTLYNSPI